MQTAHPWDGLRRAVIVAGHAVFVAPHFEAPLADQSWALAPHQTGEPPFYVEHIRRGVELAAADPDSLLIFSGGQTRQSAGPRSEAQSYWALAQHFDWWGHPLAERTSTEEHARDSFENLAFSRRRFERACGREPERLTLVSWAFKRERFEWHAKSLQLPRFDFVGVAQPPLLEDAITGEIEAALEPFLRAPSGEGPMLGAEQLPCLLAPARLARLDAQTQARLQACYLPNGPLGAWRLLEGVAPQLARELRQALDNAGYRAPCLARKRSARDPFRRGP